MCQRKEKKQFRKETGIQMVLIMALKDECPTETFKDHKIPVISIKALLAGGFRQVLTQKPGILCILSGVGQTNVKKTCLWVRDNIDPLYILNIGTAAAPDKQTPLSTWFQISKTYQKGDNTIRLDPRCPLNWPSPTLNATLESCDEPYTNNLNIKSPNTLIDMEGHTIAKMFEQSSSTVHILKWSSDRGTRDELQNFKKSAQACQASLAALIPTLFPVLDPTVDVIIPTYNRVQTLERCINSVLAQTHPINRIIVIDDGSTDNTKQCITSYGNKVHYYTQENRGVSAARNHGIKYTTASWISFLDSDDEWSPNKLTNQFETLKKYPFYQLLQSEEKWIRSGKLLLQQKQHKKPLGWGWKSSLKRCLVSASSALMHRNLFNAYGTFDETLTACEDYDLWIRLLRYIPIALDPTVSMIKHDGTHDQLSKTPILDQYRLKSLQNCLKKETYPSFKSTLQEHILKKTGILIKGAEKRGHFSMARTLSLHILHAKSTLLIV